MSHRRYNRKRTNNSIHFFALFKFSLSVSAAGAAEISFSVDCIAHFNNAEVSRQAKSFYL